MELLKALLVVGWIVVVVWVASLLEGSCGCPAGQTQRPNKDYCLCVLE